MDRLSEYDELERSSATSATGTTSPRSTTTRSGICSARRKASSSSSSARSRGCWRRPATSEDAPGYELTPQGVRKIGEKALTDIFAELKQDRIGKHDLRREGGGGERTDDTKPYEFGDPFLLDLSKTIMNAVQREAAGTPRVRSHQDDFEVYRTELHDPVGDRADGRHEPLDALQRLLPGRQEGGPGARTPDPRQVSARPPVHHRLLVPGAGDQAGDLPSIDGTSTTTAPTCSTASMLARQMLARQKGANRQIIVITDGEPTAHFDNGHVRFSYPPTPRTFQETLREVVRCTRDGITINTFMLERSPYMVQFVNDLMRINNGRVFFATPDRLGEYILVDYVANKRKFGYKDGDFFWRKRGVEAPCACECGRTFSVGGGGFG